MPARVGTRHHRTKATLATAAITASLSVALSSPANAGSTEGPDFEMPFPCGDTWNGRTFTAHSPSIRAIDWNKTNDLGAPTVSAAPGIVTTATNLGSRSYGQYVVVDHGNGWSTLYAHLSAIWSTPGQAVDQGTILGLVGSTGGSSGPHLHFEERYNRTDQTPYFNRTTFKMGTTIASMSCGDTPIIGDWDGNNTSNIGVLRRTATATFILKRPGKAPLTVAYGLPTDQPISGDWDGDGTFDIGVRRPGIMGFLLRQKDGTTTQISLGRLSDFGLTGDWNGDGRTDVGVWHPSTRLFTLRAANGITTTLTFGSLGDRPVTGDWNGDGITDLGVYTASKSTFTLRAATRAGQVTTIAVPFGTPTSLPVAGDWNADGVADVGVWDPATAKFSLRLTPTTARAIPVTRSPTWGMSRG